MSVRRQNMSCAQKTCSKHPDKIATHQLASKGALKELFYCQKCSIMLASQGCNVIKLSSITLPLNKKGSVSSQNSRSSSSRPYSVLSNRKNEIAAFVQNLEHLGTQINYKIQQVEQYLITSETEHGRMIQQTARFYKSLQQILELQKYTTYNSILNKRSIDEAKARSARDQFIQASEEVQAMLADIKQNMDAVQTVDYSIFNAIIGGYHAKLERVRVAAREPVMNKKVQQCQIVFPEASKVLLALSDKISILTKKSNNSTVHNSIIASMRPRMLTQEDEDVRISQPEERSKQSSYQEDFNAQQNGNELYNHLKKPERRPPTDKKQFSVKKRQLAFSFDDNSRDEQDIRISESINLLNGSKLAIMKGFEEGKLSKIQERLNSKQIYESRQSLGEYLNISNSRDRHFAQDTETLLIA